MGRIFGLFVLGCLAKAAIWLSGSIIGFGLGQKLRSLPFGFGFWDFGHAAAAYININTYIYIEGEREIYIYTM